MTDIITINMGSRPKGRLSWRRKLLRIGLVLGLIGALLVFFLPILFTNLIKSQVKLKRDSEIFKNWLSFPVPLSTKFHFFHVLNPEEAMSGAKVSLREVGPFTFEQWRRKEVVDWGPNDETIIYNEFKKYIFKPELSDDWDQEITTINPVVAVSVLLAWKQRKSSDRHACLTSLTSASVRTVQARKSASQTSEWGKQSDRKASRRRLI